MLTANPAVGSTLGKRSHSNVPQRARPSQRDTSSPSPSRWQASWIKAGTDKAAAAAQCKCTASLVPGRTDLSFGLNVSV